MKTSEYFGISEKDLSGPCSGCGCLEDGLIYDSDARCIYRAKTLQEAAQMTSKAVVEYGAHDIQVLELVAYPNHGYVVMAR